MFKKKRLQFGFTMIEILVVIGIIGIMMALTAPSYRNFEIRSEVKQASKELRSLFFEAQSRSLAPITVESSSYSISIIKNADQPVPVVNLIEKPGDSILKSLSWGDRIRVTDIEIDGSSIGGDNSIAAVYFIVGDNRTAGKMAFRRVDGTDFPGQKMRITIGSSATDSKYSIVLDRVINSIILERL